MIAEAANALPLESRKQTMGRDAFLDRKMKEVWLEARATTKHSYCSLRSVSAQGSCFSDIHPRIDRIEAFRAFDE